MWQIYRNSAPLTLWQCCFLHLVDRYMKLHGRWKREPQSNIKDWSYHNNRVACDPKPSLHILGARVVATTQDSLRARVCLRRWVCLRNFCMLWVSTRKIFWSAICTFEQRCGVVCERALHAATYARWHCQKVAGLRNRPTEYQSNAVWTWKNALFHKTIFKATPCSFKVHKNLRKSSEPILWCS